MILLLCAFVGGLLFGLGLWISGMSDPQKVLNFLDVYGTWDPSLLFVLGGAVAVTSVSFRLILRRKQALLNTPFGLSAKTAVDRSLIFGAGLFGIGWGLAGYCPGPGLTSLTTLSTEPLVFVAAMSVGALLQRFTQNLRESSCG